MWRHCCTRTTRARACRSRAAKPAAVAVTEVAPNPRIRRSGGTEQLEVVAAGAAADAIPPAHCEAELVVAQRAIQARKEGEPLDRVLRIQEIAWQQPPERRERLEKVATRLVQLRGRQPVPEALRHRGDQRLRARSARRHETLLAEASSRRSRCRRDAAGGRAERRRNRPAVPAVAGQQPESIGKAQGEIGLVQAGDHRSAVARESVQALRGFRSVVPDRGDWWVRPAGRSTGA